MAGGHLPEPRSAVVLRVLAFVLALGIGAAAGFLFMQYASLARLSNWAWVAAGVLSLSTAWLAWGAAMGIIGLRGAPSPALPARPELPAGTPLTARVVVVMPICNEDAPTTFARVAAMHAQLRQAGHPFDFAILSDTGSADGARAEDEALARLLAETRGVGGRIFYRRRIQNHGRKAGNIGEFLRRSGAAWDFALILDADSLMEAETIIRMARRMAAAPRLGLLQSLPRIIRAGSIFGRAMQFSAGFHGPVFTRGLARLQGVSGPFWGHNAMVRIDAFAACCGLPDLPGKPPFGGHVLSHDYVEAALLARGGWEVRVDPDLGGSYEEGPENITAHARRDRRWCQGNLQHAMLLRAGGLRFWSRATFVQGILSYLASGFWAMFLITAVLAGLWQAAPDYFPADAAIYTGRIGFLPVIPIDASARALGLMVGIFGLLLLPKLLVLAEAIVTGRARGHGGGFASTVSVLVELGLSALLAPVHMAFQLRALIQVLSGQDGGWPPNARGEGILSLAEAWAAARFITLGGSAALLAAIYAAPAQLLWLLPVLLPMIIAPLLISWSSRRMRGRWLLATPEEPETPPVVILHDRILARWQERPATDALPLAGAPGLGAPVLS